MKLRLIPVLAAAACCLVFPLSVCAADSSTEISYVQENTPSFNVTIPAALSLSKEGTALDITASDVADLGSKRISVTIAGTDYYRNQMVLSGVTSAPSFSKTVRYQLIAADGTIYETTGTDTMSGTELASFTDNGTTTYTAKPVTEGAVNIENGVDYTGTLEFGISLTD